jgi:OPA family glycerol-3-phosphate transporter-like MFS transporter
VFGTCAAVLAGLLVLCAGWLRESPQEVGVPEGDVNPLNVYGASGRQAKPESLAGLVAPLLRSRAFWCVCLLSLSMTLLRETFNNWSPTYFQEVVKLSPPAAAEQSAWFPLLGGVSVVLAGFLSDQLGRAGRATIVLVGLLLTGAALWGLGKLPAGCHPAWPVLLVTLIGFLLIGPYAYLGGAVALDFGGKRGSATACGLIDGIGYLGGVLGGAGFAGLLRYQGWSGSFTLLAFLAWASCAAAVLWHAEKHQLRSARKDDSSCVI